MIGFPHQPVSLPFGYLIQKPPTRNFGHRGHAENSKGFELAKNVVTLAVQMMMMMMMMMMMVMVMVLMVMIG